MDGFRKYGFHLPEEKASHNKQEREWIWLPWVDSVMALTGYQVAESRSYQAYNTRGFTEFNDDGDSVSSGSVFSDLGEMWRYGCPKARTGTRSTTGIKWNIGRLYGPFAEYSSFLSNSQVCDVTTDNSMDSTVDF